MGIIKEFRDFSIKGNVVDMAVGIIIGVAFGKIVSSLVNDILMPPLGVIIGGVNFTKLALTIKEAGVDGLGAVTINYGNFLQVVFDFIIVAFAVFMLIKAINRMKKKEQTSSAPQVVSKEVQLLTEIRDLLKK